MKKEVSKEELENKKQQLSDKICELQSLLEEEVIEDEYNGLDWIQELKDSLEKASERI